jgi:hypothetical protein
VPDNSHKVWTESDVVHVKFTGHMTEAVALAAIDDFARAIPVDARAMFAMHVHLGGMDKYDTSAREAWARSLIGCRKQIREIVVHDGKPLQRMAAAAVALALLVPIRFETTKDPEPSG